MYESATLILSVAPLYSALMRPESGIPRVPGAIESLALAADSFDFDAFRSPRA